MDDAYRLSIYVQGEHDEQPWLSYERVYQRRSTALGIITRARNARRNHYSKFSYATIETLRPTGELETIV